MSEGKFNKIKVENPVVELDGEFKRKQLQATGRIRVTVCVFLLVPGDEMTRVIWQLIRDTVSVPGRALITQARCRFCTADHAVFGYQAVVL